MSEALDEYNRKRDFDATPEPSGNAKTKCASKKSRPARALQFCIQKHDGTRLHYDFRLELDGPREGMPVSVPIFRDELVEIKGANSWNIHNLQERLGQLGEDPWADLRKTGQTINAEMRRRIGHK